VDADLIKEEADRYTDGHGTCGGHGKLEDEISDRVTSRSSALGCESPQLACEFSQVPSCAPSRVAISSGPK
jgi:hypothetical protein